MLSTNYGRSWQDVKKLLPAEANRAVKARQPHVSHADPSHVVVLTGTPSAWISRDGGSKWETLHLAVKERGDLRLDAWKWHPTMKDWALAESIAPPPPGGQTALHVRAPRRSVFVTQDAGRAWKLLAADVEQCHWSAKAGGDPRRVVLSRYVGAAGGSASAAAELLEVLESSDFMAKSRVLLGIGGPAAAPHAAAHVHFHFDFIAAAVPDDSGAGRLELFFATDDGRWPPVFRAAAWPANLGAVRAKQLQRLQVLYSSEYQAVLFVPAADLQLPWGHLLGYSLGSPQLELLLTDVRRPALSEGVDFQAVSGVDGVFLANRAVLDLGQDMDKAEALLDAQAEAADAAQAEQEEAAADEDDGSVRSSGALSPNKARQYAVRTYISLNMGLAWQPLIAPEEPRLDGDATAMTSANLNGTTCPSRKRGAGDEDAASTSCGLHLSRWSSAASAPGVLVGVGNAGLRLSEDPEHYSVFVSRDAGVSWKATLRGPHVVTILGHGDALLAVPEKAPSRPLYSMDGGMKWQPVDATTRETAADPGATVQGIFTHPAHTDLHAFLMTGNDGKPGVTVAMLDLTPAIPEACRMPSDPSAVAGSDFERWSPADALEDAHASKRPACLLGVRTQYMRRRADRPCRTAAAAEGEAASAAAASLGAPVVVQMRKDEPCRCTAADWACDVGYHRASFSPHAPCEPLEGALLPNVTAMCSATSDEHLEVTRGYVKSPGNRCEGGVDLSPSMEPCAANAGVAGAVRRLLGRHAPMLRAILAGAFLVGLLVLHHLRTSPGGVGQSQLALKLRACNILGKRAKFHEDDDEEREFLIQGRA